jgi:hypothetical protein
LTVISWFLPIRDFLITNLFEIKVDIVIIFKVINYLHSYYPLSTVFCLNTSVLLFTCREVVDSLTLSLSVCNLTY